MKSKYSKSILPNGKKAAEMTIGTIVVIILALVVLVVIIYGFTTGWGNLWENIKNFGGGKANLGTVAKACQVYCSSLSVADYCMKRSVSFNGADGKLITLNANCDEIKKGEGIDSKDAAKKIPIPFSGLECDMDCTTP
jgi:hypothetical protein